MNSNELNKDQKSNKKRKLSKSDFQNLEFVTYNNSKWRDTGIFNITGFFDDQDDSLAYRVIAGKWPDLVIPQTIHLIKKDGEVYGPVAHTLKQISLFKGKTIQSLTFQDFLNLLLNGLTMSQIAFLDYSKIDGSFKLKSTEDKFKSFKTIPYYLANTRLDDLWVQSGLLVKGLTKYDHDRLKTVKNNWQRYSEGERRPFLPFVTSLEDPNFEFPNVEKLVFQNHAQLFVNNALKGVNVLSSMDISQYLDDHGADNYVQNVNIFWRLAEDGYTFDYSDANVHSDLKRTSLIKVTDRSNIDVLADSSLLNYMFLIWFIFNFGHEFEDKEFNKENVSDVLRQALVKRYSTSRPNAKINLETRGLNKIFTDESSTFIFAGLMSFGHAIFTKFSNHEVNLPFVTFQPAFDLEDYSSTQIEQPWTDEATQVDENSILDIDHGEFGLFIFGSLGHYIKKGEE